MVLGPSGESAKCQSCKQDWPAEEVHLGTSSGPGGVKQGMVCAPCALAIRNTTLGIPLATCFEGEKANDLYWCAVVDVQDKRRPVHKSWLGLPGMPEPVKP